MRSCDITRRTWCDGPFLVYHPPRIEKGTHCSPPLFCAEVGRLINTYRRFLFYFLTSILTWKFYKSYFANPSPPFFFYIYLSSIEIKVHPSLQLKKERKKKAREKKSPPNFWYIVRTSSILISIVIVLTFPSFPPCSNLSQRPATRDQGNRPNNAHGAQSLEKVPLGVVHEEDTLERYQRPEEQRVRDGGRAKSFREVAQIGAKDTKPL